MKVNCLVCSGIKTASTGPWNGRIWTTCHRCGYKTSESQSWALHSSNSGTPSGIPYRKPSGSEEPDSLMLSWLGRYGVSWRAFKGAGGRVEQQRLVFSCPSFEAKRTCQPGAKPKWLSTIHKPLRAARIDEWGWGKGKTLVIVEDSLAALKASLAGFHGFPLLGTSSKDLIPSRFEGYRIRVLTDPDSAGRMAGKRLQWVLRGLDVQVHHGNEPKEYTLEELQEICS